MTGSREPEAKAVQCHHPCRWGATACWLCLYKFSTCHYRAIQLSFTSPINLASVPLRQAFISTRLESSARMSQIALPRRRLSTMMQSSAISYGAYQFSYAQPSVRRAPTIGAPEIVLNPQPTASLKRRSHIRRTTRSPISPQDSEFPPQSTSSRPERPQLTPLVTAFSQSATGSSPTCSGSVLTRQPTMIEHSAVEWRDTPRYQPRITSTADISRQSTIASVYSLPSAAPHASRRPTQENFILDWSVVDRALQNRTQSPLASSPQDHASRPTSLIPHDQYHWANGRSRSTNVDLSRSNTSQVRSLLIDRRRRSEVPSNALFK